MAKRQNSPGPLPKQKRANLVQTKVSAKPRNMPSALGRNREDSSVRYTPSNTPPRAPDDTRIQREIMTRSHPTGHSRKGR